LYIFQGITFQKCGWKKSSSSTASKVTQTAVRNLDAAFSRVLPSLRRTDIKSSKQKGWLVTSRVEGVLSKSVETSIDVEAMSGGVMTTCEPAVSVVTVPKGSAVVEQLMVEEDGYKENSQGHDNTKLLHGIAGEAEELMVAGKKNTDVSRVMKI